MRQMIAFAGILSALCCSGFAQSKEKPSAATEQAVMRIERELLNAVLKGDPSANERYLADTYVFTGPDGTVENKAQAIADLKSGDLKLQSASLDGSKVQVYGDTAIITYSSNDKGTCCVIAPVPFNSRRARLSSSAPRQTRAGAG
jgi:hypothetical protein